VVKLKDGREVEADLSRMTIGEFRAMLNPEQADAEGDAIVARVFGLDPAEMTGLPYTDFRALSGELFERIRNPESSRPLSQGASTST
jgi:hypothetical protein